MNPLVRSALALAFLASSSIPAQAASTSPIAAPIRIKDLDYVHRTYFFLANHAVLIVPGTLHVWRDDRQFSTNVYEIPAIGRIDPTSADTTAQVRGYFSELAQDEDFTIRYFWTTGAGAIPIIELNVALGSSELLAVSYLDGTSWVPVQVGTPSTPEAFESPDSALGKPANTMLLKLICPEVNRVRLDYATGFYDTTDPWYGVLSYELRNVYDLGISDIPPDRLALKVRRIDLGAADDPDQIDGRPIVEILGLDQKSGPDENPYPDGLVDDRYIDYEHGRLYFPDLHPFAPDTVQGFCVPGYGGFLCLDNLSRNFLRVGDASTSANPRVYSMPYPDPVADARYYVEVSPPSPPVPGGALRQNVPNPFNPGTRIDFELNLPGRARIAIYDIRGRLVTEMLDKDMTAGPHFVVWNGTDGTNPVASGVYYYVLNVGGQRYSRRMVLVR